MKDGLGDLLTMPPDQWQAWLDHRSAETGEVNWWLHVGARIEVLIRESSADRAAWIDRRVWLLRRAAALGIRDRTATAIDLSVVVLLIQRSGAPMVGVLSADEVVGECLDAIEVGIDAVPMRDPSGALTTLTREDMRVSRRARSLVVAAEWHAAGLADEAVAARMAAWLAIRSRLV